MPKLSIIIPVYNTAEYLSNCIDSILNQDFKDFEIILIDNHSTDGSSEILKDYSLENECIKYYRTPYFDKASVSRQFGLQFITGDFFTYVDSDDSIEPGMYSHMFAIQEKDNSDIVVCNYNLVDINNITHSYSNMNDEVINVDNLGYNSYFNQYFCMQRPNNYLWSRIIRSNIVWDNNIYFPPVDISEDTIFTMLCSSYAKKISHIKKSYYNYFQRENSTLRQTVRNKNISESYIFAFNSVEKFITDNNMEFIFEDILPTYAATRIRSILFYNNLVGKTEDDSYLELKIALKKSSISEYLKKVVIDDTNLSNIVKKVLSITEGI